MKTQEYAEAVRAKLGGASNLQIQDEYGIPNARMSEYSRGLRQPDNYTIDRWAEILGIDAEIIKAEIEAEWEKNPQRRSYWEKKLQQLGGLAASIFLVVNLIVTPTPSQAAPVLKTVSQLCILC